MATLRIRVRYFICTKNLKTDITDTYIYRGQILEVLGPLFRLSGTVDCPIIQYSQIDLKYWKEITYPHNINFVDRLSPWLYDFIPYLDKNRIINN